MKTVPPKDITRAWITADIKSELKGKKLIFLCSCKAGCGKLVIINSKITLQARFNLLNKLTRKKLNIKTISNKRGRGSI